MLEQRFTRIGKEKSQSGQAYQEMTKNVIVSGAFKILGGCAGAVKRTPMAESIGQMIHLESSMQRPTDLLQARHAESSSLPWQLARSSSHLQCTTAHLPSLWSIRSPEGPKGPPYQTNATSYLLSLHTRMLATKAAIPPHTRLPWLPCGHLQLTATFQTGLTVMPRSSVAWRCDSLPQALFVLYMVMCFLPDQRTLFVPDHDKITSSREAYCAKSYARSFVCALQHNAA
jgi:hypothetical protein